MRIGILLFEGVTALDAVGPFEVLSRVPGATVCWVGPRAGLIRAGQRLGLNVDLSFEECPSLQVLLVPGGSGTSVLMEDPRCLEFLRRQGESAEWLTSVCTGSLILGAAGLLTGYRAVTHWQFMDCLRELGAQPVRKRIVADRNRITAAGVSAGIDLGLFLAARLAGERAAQSIQLFLEYDPEPPWRCGHPDLVEPELLEAVQEQGAAAHADRLALCRSIGASLRAASR